MNARFWVRWVGFMALLYASAFFVFGAAVNATEQLTAATAMTAGFTLALGCAVVILRRKRVPPAATKWGWIAVASATGGVLALGGGAVWYLQHPHLITYSDSACEQLKQAHAESATGVDVQCRFKAYLFRAQGGVGWYAYGVSTNAEQECLFLSNDLVDPRTLDTDLSAPMIFELPSKCGAEFKELLAKYPALQW